MPQPSAMKDTVYDAVDAITAVPVIWGRQDAKKPDGDHIAITMGVTNTGDRIEEAMSGVDNIQVVRFEKETTFTLNYYGADAASLLQAVVDSLNLDAALSVLSGGDVALVRTESVQDVSALASNRWEGRAVADFVVRYVTEYQNTPNFLETIEGAEYTYGNITSTVDIP